jgi:hypothetical protein
MVARNERALSSSAAVEASAVLIEEAEFLQHNFTQTDSATTQTYSEGGSRMPPPAHSRRGPMIYTAREAAENEVRTRQERLRKGLMGPAPIIYTEREEAENNLLTRRERHRKRLMGRRSSSLTPASAVEWVRWLRHEPSGWHRRKRESEMYARKAKMLCTGNGSFQFGLKRVYIADL